MSCKILNCNHNPLGFDKSNLLFGNINYATYCEQHARDRIKQDAINEKLDAMEKAEELENQEVEE